MKILNTLVLLLLFFSLRGQVIDHDVIVSAGEEFKTESLVLNWTLGEIVTETYYSESITLSNGFLQAHSLVSAIEDVLEINPLKVYPNPVCDILVLETTIENQTYQIIDGKGTVVRLGIVDSFPFELDFTGIPSGVYILKIDQHKSQMIIKK